MNKKIVIKLNNSYKKNKILQCSNIYYDDFYRITAKVKPYNIKILRR